MTLPTHTTATTTQHQDLTITHPTSPHLTSPQVFIDTEQDVLDLIGEYAPTHLILHDHHFKPDFFDLSTKKLGHIMQKFTNYHIKVAIIGDFDQYPSNTLKDFIRETNKHRHLIFVPDTDQALSLWST